MERGEEMLVKRPVGGVDDESAAGATSICLPGMLCHNRWSYSQFVPSRGYCRG